MHIRSTHWTNTSVHHLFHVYSPNLKKWSQQDTLWHVFFRKNYQAPFICVPLRSNLSFCPQQPHSERINRNIIQKTNLRKSSVLLPPCFATCPLDATPKTRIGLMFIFEVFLFQISIYAASAPSGAPHPSYIFMGCTPLSPARRRLRDISTDLSSGISTTNRTDLWTIFSVSVSLFSRLIIFVDIMARVSPPLSY